MEGHALTVVAVLEAAALLGLALGLVTLLNVHRRTIRGYQTREDAWANRVMHMKGHTWSPPPTDTGELPPPVVEYDVAPQAEV